MKTLDEANARVMRVSLDNSKKVCESKFQCMFDRNLSS